MPPMTWRAAHTHLHNDALEVRDVMDEARRALRRGFADRALALLDAELDRDDSSAAEEESDQEPAEEESDQEPAEEPAHRCVVCGLTRSSVTLMLPTGRWANLPMEQRLVCDDCFEAAQ